MKHLIPLIALAILLQTCTSYEPPPIEEYIPNTPIKYYDIRGSTEEDLRKQIEWLGPACSDGKTHWGCTNWDFSWDWVVNEDENGNCQITGVNVGYKIDVTMPRWIPPKNATPQLIAKWRELVKALALHEYGHVKIVNENAGLVDAALWGSDCYSANSEVSYALSAIKQLNNEYDEKTNHWWNPEEDYASGGAPERKESTKTTAERFAELNKIKKNDTVQ